MSSVTTTATTTTAKTTPTTNFIPPRLQKSFGMSNVWSREQLAEHLQRLTLSIGSTDEDDSAKAVEYNSDSDDDHDDETPPVVAPAASDGIEGGDNDHKLSNNTTKQRVTLNHQEQQEGGEKEGEEERENICGDVMSDYIMPSHEDATNELLDKFRHSVRLVDDISGKINQQLVEQRRQDYMNLFLHADAVYSSPLTRALETAVLSMEGHPALTTRGITLYSMIREIKRIGGLDTVGIEVAEGIETRLRNELTQILGASRTDRLTAVPITINDCDLPWWTPIADHENEIEQQIRVREFVTFARYCDAQVPVFVGHSLFFKAFYSKRISKDLFKNRHHLSENLKKFRLSNATMLAVTVSFQDYTHGEGLSEAVMIDADIIFGGGFHGLVDHEKEEEGSSHHNHSTFVATTSTKGKEIIDGVKKMNAELQQNIQKELESATKTVTTNLKKWMKDFLES
jgi:broad specificity phosphatase PhoE